MIIIRIVTPTRQLRFQCESSDVLHTMILSKLNIKEYTAKFDNKSIDTKKTIEELKLKHGSEIRLENIVQNEGKNDKNSNTQSEPNKIFESMPEKNGNDNEVINERYASYKPNIEKPICSHEKSAMCMNCAPKNPWDPQLNKHAKYLAFEAYKEMHKKEKVLMDPLSYKKIDCDKHSTNATCSACHPRAIMLQPQVYRMIDHIEFDNKDVVDHFCSFYRQTKRQRIGFLIGKIKDYERVPMGKKVVISWVYESVQESFPDGFVVDNDIMIELFDNINNERINKRTNTNDIKKETNVNDSDLMSESKDISIKNTSTSSSCSIVDESEGFKDVKKHKKGIQSIKALKKLLKYFEMQIIGVIYTDIGRKRDYICSGLEIEFMAELQKRNKYYCEDIKNDFNSKFVTVIITNDSSENTEVNTNFCLNEFQVSEQAMELLENNLICATEDPKRMKIVTCDTNENTKYNVVPDIFYRDVNEYKINTQIKADPFLPVEYFLVKLTHGFKPNAYFKSDKYFDWRFSYKKMSEYFESKYENTKFSNLNLLIKMKMDIKKMEKDRIRREIEELEKLKQRYKRERKERIYEERRNIIREIANDNLINIQNNNNEDNFDVRIINESRHRTARINQDNNVNNNTSENFNETEFNNRVNKIREKTFDYENDFKMLLKHIKRGRKKDFDDFCASEYFADLKERLEKYENVEWACNACTFVNLNVNNCRMCGNNK